MPVFGMIFLLAGLALFAYTFIHAPENHLQGVPWVFKPKFYYAYLLSSLGFAFYGLYEIIAELRRKKQERKESEAVSSLETKKFPNCAENIELDATDCSSYHSTLSAARPHPPGTCPNCREILSSRARYCPHCGLAVKNSCPKCAFIVNPLARFCELCGHPVASPTLVINNPSVATPLLLRTAQKLRSFCTPAVVASGLLGALVLGVVLTIWQTQPPVALQTFRWGMQMEVPQQDVSQAVPLPTDKNRSPAAPSHQESLNLFQIGSTWAIDWHSKYRYRGILQIQGELAPNQYLSRITVTYRSNKNNRKTVSMDGIVNIRGKEVVISCRNPSVSWWDTDDFYLKWHQNTMTGYNVDTKGRRGKAVFTLVEGA